MAERRRTRAAAGRRRSSDADEPETVESDESRPAEDEPEDLDEDQVADEDEPEVVDEDEPEPAEDEPEPAEDEPELVDEDEPPPAEDEPEELDDDSRTAGNGGRRRPARRANSQLSAGQAAKIALSHLGELTTKNAEGITGVERTDDGWLVGIEVIEDRRIPSSSDILAIYETTIDADGELLSYRRVRRYTRGRGDSEGS